MTTAAQPIAVEKWQETLQSPLIEGGLWKRVTVLPHTDSTQDAARRLGAEIGDIIVAARQANGRGRLGRVWQQEGELGVAVTFVMPAKRSERMAIAAAVDVAQALEACMKASNGWRSRHVAVGIKWPNDVIANGRKLAGVLVEQADDRAYVGVGINVRQREWPADLRERAISLAELDFHIDRVFVIDRLIQSMGHAMRASDADLTAQFLELDVLSGTTCGFRIGEREIRGKVLRVDPMHGLAVLTDNDGEVWLPAATTTVI
jgi:BirA family biotin operon repressor/biotin-[acetyl-CoA-carboxylase] ligase